MTTKHMIELADGKALGRLTVGGPLEAVRPMFAYVWDDEAEAKRLAREFGGKVRTVRGR